MHNITSLGIKVFLPLKSVTVEFPGSILGIDTDDPRYGNFGNLSGNESICSRKPFSLVAPYKELLLLCSA